MKNIHHSQIQSQTIICDPGTGYMKVGFAGDNFPRATFASLIGRPMLRSNQSLSEDIQLKQIMVGDEAQKYRALLQLSHPTEQGIVQKWDDMQILLKYSFAKIGVNSMIGRSVFMTQAIMNPIQNKCGMLQLMFQKLGIQRIQYGYQALMSVFAQGLQTALLLDLGDGVTHCLPIYAGTMNKPRFQRMNIAGRHITNNLSKLLQMRGYALNSTSDFQTLRQIKQKLCFVSGDFKIDKKLSLQTTVHQKAFILPDGQAIKIGRERFQAPEILFNPSFGGYEMDGCAQMVFSCITKSDLNTRKQLYNNIVISGGTSMTPGFPTRLKRQVQQIFSNKINKASQTIKIRIIDSPSRKYSVFIGASIIAKVHDDYPQTWKFKRQYSQKGKQRLAQEMSI